MYTAGIMYWTLRAFRMPIDIRNICVFIGPVFAGFSTLATYFLATEVAGRSEAGLFAAQFIAVIPSYISRSVAGSYDNESIAIFALIFCFYMFIKALRTGSILISVLASLSLFYMAGSWGGYAFIINIIPIFVLFQLITEKFTYRHYVSYSIFYIIGTIYVILIPFIGTQAIYSSEHLASHLVFILIQVNKNLIYCFAGWIKKLIGTEGILYLQKLFLIAFILTIVIGFIFLAFSGKTQWSGRSMTLLDPTYAQKYIPIIASVKEHQSTEWSSFYFKLQLPLLLTPLGLFYCFKKGSDGMIFIAIYVVLACYFAGVMVRLLLVLAPAVCIAGGIGLSFFLRKIIHNYHSTNIFSKIIALIVKLCIILLICWFVTNFVWFGNQQASDSYSSPSIITKRRINSKQALIDDFRDAYY